jgi:hypothetical protein
MKKYLFLFISMGFAAISCVSTGEPDENKVPDITTFFLRNGAKDGISTTSIKFTINQDSAKIYNTDSLPYLTKIDSLVPIISGAGISTIVINDTIKYNFNDPDTISFRFPVKFFVTAKDGKTTKTYTVNVRVHQQDPGKYVWNGVKSPNEVYSATGTAEKLVFINEKLHLYVSTASGVKLYTSIDGSEWVESVISGFPNSFNIKYIVQTMEKLAIAQGNKIYFSTDGISWTEQTTSGSIDNLLFALNSKLYGIDYNSMKLYALSNTNWEETVNLPTTFPISGEAIWVDNSTAGVERVFVVGGQDTGGNLLNSVFATENGRYWVNINSLNNSFTARKDVALFQYDNQLMIIGGQGTSGLLTSDIQLVSVDFGINWQTPVNNQQLTPIFLPRYNAQVVTNSNKTILYIVGGQTSNNNFIKDCWTCMKNELLW